MTTLDVTALPFEQVYECTDGMSINMYDFLRELEPVLNVMGTAGIVRENTSFGFAMAEPIVDAPDDFSIDYWDDPYKFAWFVGGWGDEKDRLIANAVRKLRPLLRRQDEWSTLDMRFFSEEKPFMNTVNSRDDDGNYPWGDFPWGGASVRQFGRLHVIGACSGFSEIEDDMVTNLILTEFAKRVVFAEDILPD